MDNIRSGNLSVKKMLAEIEKDVLILESRYPSKRVVRQLDDYHKFIQMISKAPYSKCKTVSTLKKKISEERNKLKEGLVKKDKYMPGHQFSMFEQVNEVSEAELKEVEAEVIRIKQELHWLHKCLGIASNRKYFK